MTFENIIPIDFEKKDEKERIFETIVENDIIQAFSDDLAEADFDKDQIAEFEREIGKLDEESIKSVLSLPKELRSRNFPKYKELIDTNKKTISQIVSNLAEQTQANGYTLGYHATNSEIIPHGDEWMIDGYEYDDRDNRPMAYYSLDYKNIYRATRLKYLYIVRANVSQNTEHKKDTSNNWGRADTLAIVHKIDLAEIDEEVEKIYEEEYKQKDAA